MKIDDKHAKDEAVAPHNALQRMLPYVLFGCSLFGLIASFALTYDKVQILQNPGYTPNCNLSPILSCKSVMETPQANVFGAPNSVYGLVGFGMLNMFSIMLKGRII